MTGSSKFAASSGAGVARGDADKSSSLVWIMKVTIFSKLSEDILRLLLLLERESCLHTLGRSDCWWLF